MVRRRAVRNFLIIATAIVVVAGCGEPGASGSAVRASTAGDGGAPAGQTDSPRGSPTASAPASAPLSASTDAPDGTGVSALATMTDALGRAGIDVASDDAPRSGRGTITITAAQAAVWAQEWGHDTGISGRQLERLYPTPPDGIPLSALVAAWLTSSQLPGAAAARTLMDPPVAGYPDGFRFPTAVLAMFVQDVTSAGVASGDAPSGFRAPGSGEIDPCGMLSGLYEATIGKITSWFATTGADSIIVEIAGEALSLFGKFLGKAIGAALAPLLGPIKAAIGALGVATAVAGALAPWTAEITATPTQASFGTQPGPGQKGTFTVTVTTPLPDWPVGVRSCASLAGVELPSVSPAGSLVEWTLSGNNVATEERHDGVLSDPAATASLDFVTGTESAEDAQGEPVVDTVLVVAEVQRDTSTLSIVLAKLISSALDALPDVIVLLLSDVATDPLTKLLAASGTTAISDPVPVTHHAPPPTDPPAPPPGQRPPVDPPAPPAAGSCVARELISQLNKSTSGDMSTIMPGAVTLWLDPNHTGYLDFNDSTDFFGDNFKGHVTGKITFHWSGGPTHFTTSDARGTLTARVKTMGTDNTIELPVETMVQNSESMVCQDGEITIERTGWVFY